MGKRKINRVGTSTLTVSLPSKWARTHGLKAGDEVTVQEEGKRLVVDFSSAGSEPKKAALYFKKDETVRKRYLQGLYKDGYDEIEITSEQPMDLNEVKKALRELLGFELVEASSKRAVVKKIATPNETEFENIFRKLFLLDISMIKTILDSCKSAHYDGTEVQEMEEATNRLSYYCQRVLIGKDREVRSENFRLYYISMQLETIADHLKRIGVSMKARKKVSPSLLSCLEKTLAFFERLYAQHYKQDSGKVDEIKAERNKLFDSAYGLLDSKRLTGEELKAAALLLEILTCTKEIEVNLIKK